ncbi:MAG: pimeloyl-ACP methyl esterase BioG family protein [Victivallaceae bacterium]
MKYSWINQKNNSRLLVFFNGWGMDEKPFRHLVAGELDVLMFYDYTEPEMPLDLNVVCAGYKQVLLVAWSLGVWAAAEAADGNGWRFEDAVAINGTLRPIDEICGIAPAVFQGTIDSWSEIGRKKFNRRMCASPENLAFFNEHHPERTVESQHQELVALQNRILNHKLSGKKLFTRAVTGTDDRIFLATAQVAAWREEKLEVINIAAAHYPFAGLNSWREAIEIGQA